MCYSDHQKLLDTLTIKRGNLLEIRLTEAITAKRDSTSGTSGSSIQLNSKPIVYEPNAQKATT